MKQKVWVTLTGTQRNADGETDTNVTEGPGLWLREETGEEPGHRIVFSEGSGNVLTVVFLAGKEMRVVRRGEISAEMIFRPGERTSCRYETQPGTIEMKIETIKTGLRETDQRIDAAARYHLYFENGDYQENTIALKAVCV